MNRSGVQSVFVGVLLASLVLLAEAISASWDQHAGDTGNTRYVETGQDSAGVVQAWHFELDPDAMSPYWHEHGIATDGTGLYFSANDQTDDPYENYVYRLNFHTGQMQWQTKINSRQIRTSLSAPTLYNGQLFVNRAGHSASGGVDAKPTFFRLDPETGQVTSSTNYQAQQGTNFRAKPIGGQMLVAGGYYGGTYGFPGSDLGSWFKDDYYGPSDREESYLAGTEQFAVMNQHKINPANGSLIGTYTHPDALTLTNPVISGNHLYYAAASEDSSVAYADRYKLSRFNAQTNAWDWDKDMPSPVRRVAVSPNLLLVQLHDRFIGYDPDTGQQAFEWFDHQGEVNFDYGWEHLVLTDSHVYFTGSVDTTNGFRQFKQVYALDLEKQEVTWSQRTNLIGWRSTYEQAHLAVSNGMLFVSNYEGVTAFRIAAPDPINIAPTFDARADWNGSSFDVSDGDDTMLAQVIDHLGIDRRMLMEFDLSGVPTNAHVISASLGLDISSFTSTLIDDQETFGTIELYAYSGDGLLTSADATAGLTRIGTSDRINALGEINIDLDPDAINALVQEEAGYLGLVGVSGSGNEQFGVFTTEGHALVEGWAAPALTIAFDWLATGDLNGDGSVDQSDISAFALALIDEQGFESAYPFIDRHKFGDFNGDGVMNNLDLFGFVQLLSAGNESEAQAIGLSIGQQIADVPEPASIGLIGLGAWLLFRRPEYPQ